MSETEHEDPFRYCAHCGVDCYVEDYDVMEREGVEYADEVAHKADCPSVTGLYPITGQDLGPLAHCPKCDHEWRLYGMRCSGCNIELKEGDFVVHKQIEDDVVTPMCVGCGALNAEMIE